jgi:hypothetical protein
VSWAHGAVHHRRGRSIKDARLNEAIFFKDPLDFYVFACQSFHLYKPSQTGLDFYVSAPAFFVK